MNNSAQTDEFTKQKANIKKWVRYNYSEYEKPAKERRRLDPQDRFEYLLTTYIDILSGKTNIRQAHYLKTGHTEIAEATDVPGRKKVCVATIFNYFRTVEILRFAAVEWSVRNIRSDNDTNREAAEAIAAQVLSADPGLSKRFKMKLVLTAV